MTSLAVHADQPVEGVPLVLLHAFPLDSSMWSPVLPALRGIPVVTIDAPGFGDAPPREHAGLEEYAHDVVVAVRELGHDQAVIAGLSMGGYVAMAVAEATPGVLAGIGLLSTKAAADAEPAREKRLAMAAAADRGEPDLAVPMLDGLLGRPAVTGGRISSTTCASGCGPPRPPGSRGPSDPWPPVPTASPRCQRSPRTCPRWSCAVRRTR